jgi:hypothetical protein
LAVLNLTGRASDYRGMSLPRCFMSHVVISRNLLRPRSLPGGPATVERSAVSRRLGAAVMKVTLLGAGVSGFAAGLWQLAADDTDGLRMVIGAIGLLGWGLVSPLRYSVDLHRRGSVRSLLTTHDRFFAERVSRLINTGLADIAAMPTYYVNVKGRTIAPA